MLSRILNYLFSKTPVKEEVEPIIDVKLRAFENMLIAGKECGGYLVTDQTQFSLNSTITILDANIDKEKNIWEIEYSLMSKNKSIELCAEEDIGIKKTIPGNWLEYHPDCWAKGTVFVDRNTKNEKSESFRGFPSRSRPWEYE